MYFTAEEARCKAGGRQEIEPVIVHIRELIHIIQILIEASFLKRHRSAFL